MTDTSLKATFIMTDGMETVKAAVTDIDPANLSTIVGGNNSGAGKLSGLYQANLEYVVLSESKTWTVEAE